MNNLEHLNNLLSDKDANLQPLEGDTTNLVKEFRIEWLGAKQNTLLGFLLTLSNNEYRKFLLLEKHSSSDDALSAIWDIDKTFILDPMFIAIYSNFEEIPNPMNLLKFNYSMNRLHSAIKLIHLHKSGYIELIPNSLGDHKWGVTFTELFKTEAGQAEEVKNIIRTAISNLKQTK